jgi:heme oxygenase (mycobilin-producing)
MAKVRVILWYRANDEQVRELADTYRTISQELVGTPGMLSNELLHSKDEPGVIMVTSYWESYELLQDWVRSASHDKTSPLRPYMDRAREHTYETFDVLSAY